MAKGSIWRLVFFGAALMTFVSGVVGLIQQERLDAVRGFGFALLFAFFARPRR